METKPIQWEKGMWIWAEHAEDVWRPARIVKVLDKLLQVSFMDGKAAASISKKRSWTVLSIESFNEDMQSEDITKDFSKMSSLSTESVLHFLRKAYYSNMYYSHLGAGTILAVNPFHDVKGLFSNEKMQTYHSATLSELAILPPHIFAVAERALRNMLNDMCFASQSIIISGESGAGKTWTVRCLMRYLALVGMQQSTNSFGETRSSRQTADHVKLSDSFVGEEIEHRILCSNPILEAFGNATTQRNHNSSRFGKFIQLQYDWCGNIVGARLQVYLLEKTRVATRGKSDQPYHIFMQMQRGCSGAERSEWLLPEETRHPERHCNNNNNNRLDFNHRDSFESGSDEDDCDSIVNDMEAMDGEIAFRRTCNAMLSVGISTSLQKEIFKILSAILHLEKMSFEGDDDLRTPCALSTSSQLNGKHAASLLSVPINSLLQAVTVREIQAGSSTKPRMRRRSVFMRSCTMDECAARRDALMKYLYEQLFLWLVKRIGDDLSSQPDKACSFIGLLDVYGFESFQQNGLEQLCINYANEKLQQYYVNNFLKVQQEELTSEGVAWTSLNNLKDKEGCLTALEATRGSLFALLNEECRLNRACNALQLKDRIGEEFSGNSFVSVPRISTKSPSFGVAHYAGTVHYETGALITKNKDELPVEIGHLLKHSNNPFIERLVSKKLRHSTPKQNGSRGKNHETLLTEFKKSLDDLLSTLSSTSCHYIRCIKPNRPSMPRRFDSFYVADQLQSSGVVETVEICGQLHPHRITYPQFVAQYRFLIRNPRVNTSLSICHLLDGYTQVQRMCCKILTVVLDRNPHLKAHESWKFGKTSLFLSSTLSELLQIERTRAVDRSATKIHSYWLAYRNRLRCRKIRKRLWEERRAAVRVFEKAWKAKLLWRQCSIARKIEIRRREEASFVIQACWRRYRDRMKELSKLKAFSSESDEMVTLPVKSDEMVTLPVISDEMVTLPVKSDEMVTLPVKSDEMVTLPVISAEMVTLPVKSAEMVTLSVESDEMVTLEPVESAEMVTLPVMLQSSLHHASLRDADLEIDPSRTEADFRRPPSHFVWMSRPKHNRMERYFPSMVLMDLCPICCEHARPIDVVGIAYRKSGRNRSDRKRSLDDTFSSANNSLLDDSLSLPFCSFNLNDASFRVTSPRRHCILPFSYIEPKRV